jgi:hypothetical protein
MAQRKAEGRTEGLRTEERLQKWASSKAVMPILRTNKVAKAEKTDIAALAHANRARLIANSIVRYANFSGYAAEDGLFTIFDGVLVAIDDRPCLILSRHGISPACIIYCS